MKKKIISIILSLIMLMGVGGTFTACGSSGDMVFFVSAQAHELVAIKELVAKYTELTGTKIVVNDVTSESNSYFTKLKAYASSKKMPDIFYMGPGQTDYYLNNNQLLDLTDLVAENTSWNYEDLYEELRKEYIIDGRIYGIPGSFSDYPMGYNRVIIDQVVDAGLWPYDKVPLLPWEIDPDTGKQVVYTWQQFSDAAAACTFPDDGVYGTGLLERWSLHSWIWTAGGDWLSEDKKTVTVNTPEFKKGLREFYELHRTRNAVAGIASESEQNHYQRWLSGGEAFFNVGTWDVGGFDKVSPTKFKYGIMPVPRSNDEGSKWYTYRGFGGFSVAKKTKHAAAAVDFILYYTTSQDAYDLMVKEHKIVLPATQSKKEAYINDSSITPVGKELFLSAMDDGNTKRLPTTYTYNSEWYDYFYENTVKFWGGPGAPATHTVEAFLEWVQPGMQERLNRALTQQAQDEARRK